jgi:tetratricopeptide (TPR) repeat protein
MIRRSIDARGESNENLGEQLTCLGTVVRRQGRTEEAEEIYARALALLRKLDPVATVFALRNVAYLYWLGGHHDRAVQIYDEMPECDTDQLGFLTDVLKPFAEPPLPVQTSTEFQSN